MDKEVQRVPSDSTQNATRLDASNPDDQVLLHEKDVPLVASSKDEDNNLREGVDPAILLKEKLKMSLLKKKLQQPQRSSDSTNADDKIIKTVHVRIDNFQRPLHVKGLLQWLCQTCEVTLKEENIWINAIKTHCYVDFENLEDAEKCVSIVTGKKFPATNTSTLVASFTSVSAKDAPKSEEASLKPNEWKGHGKGDVPSTGSVQASSSGSGGSSAGNIINKNEALKRKLSEAMESSSTAAPANLFKRAAVSAITNTPRVAAIPASSHKSNDHYVVESDVVQDQTPQLRHTKTKPSISWCPVSESVAQTRIKLFRHRMGMKTEKPLINT